MTGTLELPWALLGLSFGLDRTSGVFLALTLLLWLLAAVHARGYLAHDPRRRRFFAFFPATFAGNLGLVLARDAAGFYLFFTVMTFAAYGLVVHDGSAPALRAGRVYIAMAVLGEALLLGGLMLAAAGAPSLALADMRAAAGASAQRDAIVALLFAGFGVKAGVLGLHMWLPLAHPVAPTPASAVLSGAMIKAGVLGWVSFLPLGEVALPMAGLVVAVAGLAAVFHAAVAGVLQDDPKTVLAYSSIGQVGFITVAVGAGLAAPQAAPAAVAAAAYYALHHGLAKGALFLGVGIAPRLGTAAHLGLLALPALVLAGLPLTSGAVAKLALKGLVEVFAWSAPMAALLSVGAVGTTLLMARFLFLLHVRRDAHGTRSTSALAAWLLAIAAALGVGLLPAAALGLPLPKGPSWLDAWPLAAGVALALLSVRAGGALPRLRSPPGDVLAPLMRLAGGGTREARAAGERLHGMTMAAFRLLQVRWRAFVDALGRAWEAREARLRLGAPGAAVVLLAALFLLAA